MHYYQFNIKEYRKDTAYLCLTEHAIYRSLIDTYYLNEMPLCSDIAKLMRSHSVRSAFEKECFENVLNDFFTLCDDGYRHGKIDQELNKIYEKSEKARKSAEARWAKHANAMRTHSECNANGMLPINPLPINPLTNTLVPAEAVTTEDPIADQQGLSGEKNNVSEFRSSKTPPCPHLKIIDLYHEVLPELGAIAANRWKGSKRETWLQSRWREDKKHQTLEFWEWYFNSIKTLANGFYIGQNDRDWKANLEWLVKRENFDKMIDRIVAERAQA